MNTITYTQAVKLISEIETGTGRYAKAQAGRDGRDGRAILARWIG